eukprot:6194823-Pleurochrysis_carterae.AAC.1
MSRCACSSQVSDERCRCSSDRWARNAFSSMTEARRACTCEALDGSDESRSALRTADRDRGEITRSVWTIVEAFSLAGGGFHALGAIDDRGVGAVVGIDAQGAMQRQVVCGV